MERDSTNSLLQERTYDFWKFWTGQVISSLGSSFTRFALPLLIFKLTGSAINLSLAFLANLLPYLLFGLVIGALVDRINRKRAMIACDVLRAGTIIVLPIFSQLGLLNVWWIYAVTFVSSTLSICFDSASFAALPSLVKQDDLVTANGRIQASYSLASILGPLIAALLLATVSLPWLLACDSLSFLASAGSLLLVRTSFNPDRQTARQERSIRQNIIEGLRYIVEHPVLKWLTLLLLFVNLVLPAITTQFVLFAKQALTVSDAQLAFLYTSGSIGVVAFSLLAGRLRKYVSYSLLILVSLFLDGLLVISMAVLRWYGVVLVLWALSSGFVILFDITNYSAGQSMIPNYLLGRVVSFIKVLTWSVSPIGAFIGGLAITRTGNAALVYVWFGVLACAIPLVFAFTPLRYIERFLPAKDEAQRKEKQDMLTE